jgi:hypothetical protein
MECERGYSNMLKADARLTRAESVAGLAQRIFE